MTKTHLGRDKLKARELPPCLLVDNVLNLGVDLGERSVEGLVLCTYGEQRASERAAKRLTKSGVDEEAIARLRREVVVVEERMGRERRRNIFKRFPASGDQVISSPREEGR